MITLKCSERTQREVVAKVPLSEEALSLAEQMGCKAFLVAKSAIEALGGAVNLEELDPQMAVGVLGLMAWARSPLMQGEAKREEGGFRAVFQSMFGDAYEEGAWHFGMSAGANPEWCGCYVVDGDWREVDEPEARGEHMIAMGASSQAEAVQ